MTEILPCFYCGKPCRTNRLTGEGLYVECTGENCYSGPIFGENIEKQCIKQHNFIAKAVLEAEKKENPIYWLGAGPTWYIYDDPNLDKKEESMTSIFDMTDTDLRKLVDNENICKDEHGIDLFNFRKSDCIMCIPKDLEDQVFPIIKKLIDRQIAYFEQKKEEESKEFKVGWVYEDTNFEWWLILKKEKEYIKAIDLRLSKLRKFDNQGKYVIDKKFGYQCLPIFYHLIHSTGKKWEATE